MTATKCIALNHVILVDEQDREIGSAEKMSAHEKNLLHRAFSAFIFRETPTASTQNKQYECLLQQRALHKYHAGGLWTNTCCSHPRPGEPLLSAGKRRLQEELGIETELKNVGSFHYNVHFSNGLSENEIDHVLIGTIPASTPIYANPDEIHAYRWITLDALHHELAFYPEQFTPWFAKALNLALQHIHLA